MVKILAELEMLNCYHSFSDGFSAPESIHVRADRNGMREWCEMCV